MSVFPHHITFSSVYGWDGRYWKMQIYEFYKDAGYMRDEYEFVWHTSAPPCHAQALRQDSHDTSSVCSSSLLRCVAPGFNFFSASSANAVPSYAIVRLQNTSAAHGHAWWGLMAWAFCRRLKEYCFHNCTFAMLCTLVTATPRTRLHSP